MVAAEGLDLVERNEDPQQERLVLLLQRESKPVDDTEGGRDGGKCTARINTEYLPRISNSSATPL